MPGTYHGQGEVQLLYSIHLAHAKGLKLAIQACWGVQYGCMGAWLDSVYAMNKAGRKTMLKREDGMSLMETNLVGP